MLDRERNEMCITDEVRRGSEGTQQLAHESGVPAARVNDDRAGLSQPPVDQLERTIRRQRSLEDPVTRAHPQEGEQNGPCKRDGASADSCRSSQDRAALWRGDRSSVT
jgi:hypothetical protein